MIGFTLAFLAIVFVVGLATMLSFRDKATTSFLRKHSKRLINLGPYRTSQKPDPTSETPNDLTEKKGVWVNEKLAKEMFEKRNAPKHPVKLETTKNGKHLWFDLARASETYQSTTNNAFTLYKTRHGKWVEKIGEKYFLMDDEKVLAWFQENDPAEFAKRDGWDQMSEI